MLVFFLDWFAYHSRNCFCSQPFSQDHKNYIANLDIDADIAMLRDTLQLDSKSLLNFYASSLLLQRGVAAGLTLYEIALLCCRNDNEAVEPSLLEKVVALSYELAEMSVPEEERLSATMAKSASSGAFLPLLHVEKDEPEMAASTDSSSSSEGSAVEDHPSEWAAQMVQTLPALTTCVTPQRTRSESVVSAGEGFWTVPPSHDTDDGVSWQSSTEGEEIGEVDFSTPPPTVRFAPEPPKTVTTTTVTAGRMLRSRSVQSLPSSSTTSTKSSTDSSTHFTSCQTFCDLVLRRELATVVALRTRED